LTLFSNFDLGCWHGLSAHEALVSLWPRPEPYRRNFHFFIFQSYYVRYVHRLRILQALAVWCFVPVHRWSWRGRTVCWRQWRRETARGMSGVRRGRQTPYVRPPTVAAVDLSGDDIFPRRRVCLPRTFHRAARVAS